MGLFVGDATGVICEDSFGLMGSTDGCMSPLFLMYLASELEDFSVGVSVTVAFCQIG